MIFICQTEKSGTSHKSFSHDWKLFFLFFMNKPESIDIKHWGAKLPESILGVMKQTYEMKQVNNL